MCHNSVLESEQIDRCIQNGMPHKIIKSVKYTMRRRAAAAITEPADEAAVDVTTSNKTQNIRDHERKSSRGDTFQMKCPFAHGLIKVPQTTASPVATGQAELQFPTTYERNVLQRHSEDDDDAIGITNLSGQMSQPPEAICYREDILAKGTQYTKRFTFYIQHTVGRLQKSKLYT